MKLKVGSLLALFALIFGISCGGGNEQKAVFVQKTMTQDTLTDAIPLERLETLVSKNASGAFPSSWVISPAAPTVVRQNHSSGPTYQEALGYTFLIHSMKRPRLVRMDKGRLVLVATAWLHKEQVEDPIVLTSDDEGKSWSQPREIPTFGTLVSLGNGKLMIFGDNQLMSFSEDAGNTWSKPQPLPPLRDGRESYHHGSVLVEGQTVTAIFFVGELPRSKLKAGSFLRSSQDAGHTWGEPIFLPDQWNTSEGSITRAQDGALVAALRTDQLEGYPSYNDGWRRITTARSTDNGRSWTSYQVHFKYGKVHSDLLTLANDDILLTYAVRTGELDGHVYHGIEAVLSHDNGKTWDWANKFILFRWSMQQSMHSPASVVLSDGRILTVFLYNYDAPWGKPERASPMNIGMVDGLIWSLKKNDSATE